jgi:hypothetical protein
MDNIWILAQAPGGEEPSGITSEPVTAEETTTTAVASDPNAATARRESPKPFTAETKTAA